VVTSDFAKTKVLLADDHVVIAHGLSALLEEFFDLVGVVHDGRALLDAVEKLRPDVVVTDISMPLLNGLDAIIQIRELRPGAKIVVLTMHGEAHLAAAAFRAGASGYLLKLSPVEELVSAIQQVAQGRSYITTLIAKDLITLLMDTNNTSGADAVPLTNRQREVLQLIAEGKTMKEVATTLNISSRTAESHKYEIMKVLGVGTTAELVQYAIKTKLIGE
jgi:DNA-binding NarL/FixJ family response regulator